MPKSSLKLTFFKKTFISGGMWTVISVKMDPKMKKALEKFAEKEFSPVSAIVKKAIEKYLLEQGIDWKKEKVDK